MHPQIVGPQANQPNYEARVLFFEYLDAEWPSLKESLLEAVWPSYRACWTSCSLDDLPWPPRGYIRTKFHGEACAFVAPQAVRDWPKLMRSHRCRELRHALRRWGAAVEISSDWFLASALLSLGQFSPGREKPEHPPRPAGPELSKAIGASSYTPAFEWRYHHEFHGRQWGFLFEPKLVGTIAHPTEPARWLPHRQSEWYYGSWKQFEQRMRNQFESQLSHYHRSMLTHWGLNKGNHLSYARWTIARLSGLKWREVVARYPELQKYVDGEAQAKKRVREFTGEIGLT
jgi:hypothetical protein